MNSLMFESPTITCSRRNRSASACGSSRVLMIGRDRVVADDTPSQMCSARWLMQNCAPRGPVQHLAGAAVDLPGDEERDQHVGHAGELALPGHQVVLVAAVGVPGRVGVVLEQVDVAGDALLVQAHLGRASRASRIRSPALSCAIRSSDLVALGRGVLGVGADVEVQAGAVLQEHVRRTAPVDDAPEQVAGDLVGDSRRCPRNVHVTPYSFSRPKIRRSIATVYARRVRNAAELPEDPATSVVGEAGGTCAAAARAVEHAGLEVVGLERALLRDRGPPRRSSTAVARSQSFRVARP